MVSVKDAEPYRPELVMDVQPAPIPDDVYHYRLHSIAMATYDLAKLWQKNGDRDRYLSLVAEAYSWERRAAEFYEPIEANEPSRSIYFRSAAYMALECGRPGSARDCALDGLRSPKPLDDGAELREVLAKADEDIAYLESLRKH